MKKLLVLGGGVLQKEVVLKAKSMGIYTIVADKDSSAIGLSFADMPLVVDIVDPKAVLHAILGMGINGVIHPCSEVAMNTLGVINEEFNLCGIDQHTAMMSTNKQLMREAFEKSHASSPISFGTNSYNEFLKYLNDLNCISIVKPSRNSGSRGVACVSKGMKQDDLKKAFEIALYYSRDNSIVVEEYIEGPEFSVEIIIYDGTISVLAITDKLTTGDPHFVELGHSQPSRHSEDEIKKVIDVAIAGCKALNINNCAAHAEVKIQRGIVYLMEIGARLGGDFISTELVHLSTGIDMVAAAINVAMGEKPDLIPKHSCQGVAIRYFVPKPGRLISLDFSKVHLSDKRIHQFQIYKKINDIINPLSSSLDRSGHIITTGKSAKEAIDYADKILKLIDYSVQ